MAQKEKTKWEELKDFLNPLGPKITESIERRRKKQDEEEEKDEDE